MRPIVPDQADQLLSLFREPLVRRYLLDDQLVEREWVEGEIASSEDRFTRIGSGLWAVGLSDAPEVVGVVGFREFPDPPPLQLLFAVHPAHWGQGLATEVARAICDHAFGDLGFGQISAVTDAPNRASARVLERLGMTLVSGEGAASKVYEVKRSEWVGPEGADEES